MKGINGKLRVSNWKCIAVSLVLAAVVGLLAWPALVQSEALTHDQKEARAVENAKRPVRRAAPEKTIGGITIEERLAQQARMNARLVAKMPERAMETPVQIELSKRDRDDLAAPAVSGVPLLIGVVKAIPSDVGAVRGDFKGGTFEKTPDGGFVWAATVTSPGAQAIRVHFEGFSLPPDAETYFYSLNGQAHGPYTGNGRNGNGEFWTRSIQADTGVIQLHVKEGVDQQQISFMVSDLGHIQGRSTAEDTTLSHDTWPCYDNVACLIDAMCMSGTPADPAKDAVAKMEWIIMPYIYTCTGGLLADTDPGTQIPYMLTANHCFDTSILNLETFFWYTTDSCNGTCPDSLVHGGTPPPSDTMGITVVATGTAGDFTLATLDEDPPSGVTFLGWNNAEIAYTDGAPLYRISNANFGPQVYADYEVDTGSPTCGGIPRGAWIYSTNIQGSTMGGSSGSPVLNSDSQVVGQLTGCCGYNCSNDCDFANNWTIDGALYYYWDSVADFLDPPGCSSEEECNDGNECTNDLCTDRVCQNPPKEDNTECSGGVCCSGTCNTPVCSLDGDCDDFEACTTDTCLDAGICTAYCENTWPACGSGESGYDGCCGPSCNSINDSDCSPFCGNGICEGGDEDCNTCSSDCIAGSGAVCGNSICEAADGEDCQTCPDDCNGKVTGKPDNRYCCGSSDPPYGVVCSNPNCEGNGITCTTEPTDPSCCGNNICEGDETVVNCIVDCGCTNPSDCDDLNECTFDDCVGGACQSTPLADDISCSGGICCGGTCTTPACSINADCGGSESCPTDTCLNGGLCSAKCEYVWPECGQPDGCCVPDCTPVDPDCPECNLLGEECTQNSDCCSNKCVGKPGSKTCK